MLEPTSSPPRASLANGILIQGAVRGWLFGLPVLKINTTLVVSPAQIDGAACLMPELPGSSRVAAAGGRRLTDAVKAIGEAAEQLANAKHAGE